MQVVISRKLENKETLPACVVITGIKKIWKNAYIILVLLTSFSGLSFDMFWKKEFFSVFVMNCTTQKVFWFIFFLFSAGLSTQYLVWRWLLKCIMQQGLLHIMLLLWKEFKFISHKVVIHNMTCIIPIFNLVMAFVVFPCFYFVLFFWKSPYQSNSPLSITDCLVERPHML